MELLFSAAGNSPALNHAISCLQTAGIRFASSADPQVSHLLLPVPTPTELLNDLPDVTIIGGNLPPLKQASMDLLQDPEYLARNAAITAHCALRYAMEALPCTLDDCPVLILGWGRIGKCLARLLRNLDARVTIAARSPTDRAMAHGLGYRTLAYQYIQTSEYRVIYNTVPQMLLPEGADCLCIDLASRPGIGGDHVIWARGLPGKDAPESSGALIAQTVLRLL